MAKNPITIEVLETIDAIDRRGSYAKAAEELNKATSAVSYAVQKLEEQLDIALFRRQGRRSVLTPAGQVVLAEGRDILQTTARLANKAKEVATGWEPRINIGLESSMPYPGFFAVLNEFLQAHPSIEIDVCDCVLNGGWEALEQDRVDLIVGSPGPAPLQKGYRVVPVPSADWVPVVAASHAQARSIATPQDTDALVATLRRVITHDTSINAVARSAGLSRDGRKFYVQTIDQKLAAIRAGIGIGHLPRHRVQALLDTGELLELTLADPATHDYFLAWKLSNKGKGLQTLSKQLVAAFG